MRILSLITFFQRNDALDFFVEVLWRISQKVHTDQDAEDMPSTAAL